MTAALYTQLKGKLNLASVKFISLVVSSLCKVQIVTFDKLANAFNSFPQSGSSLSRIQRFIAGYPLGPGWIAERIFSLLPEQSKVKLTIDRTHWKFGRLAVLCRTNRSDQSVY